MQFQGFKPESLKRIANTLGYNGDMSGFDSYLANNPDKQAQMNTYNTYAMQMAKGGMARKKYLFGGLGTTLNSTFNGVGSALNTTTDAITDAVTPDPEPPATPDPIEIDTMSKLYNPQLPGNVSYTPEKMADNAADNQFLQPDSGSLAKGDITTDITQAGTTLAHIPDEMTATTMNAATATPAMKRETADFTGATGTVSKQAQVNAAQGTSNVLGIEAAQGTATLMDNPVQREIQSGELLDLNATAGQAEKAAKFTEQIQAATATPSEKATVQGQLESLMQDFEGGETPSWAAGAMRAATSQMAARGLSASSMAGQAIVQAAMEAALPIAAQDASTFSTFEQQNLSNRQQRAMLAAQQRAEFLGQEFDQAFQARVFNASKIADVANMNFTAEQQVALENARAANTMNLANLNNRQAKVMADVAAIANMDMANLSNRQAAAVMNAQSFLQMDMANLSNDQQSEMVKQQGIIQSILSDTAAENAARQFNATSQNQVDQFFAGLEASIAQTNAAQANAQSRFNAGESNVMERFLADMANERDQFEATRRLVIDQNNVTWRRSIATADTAAINRSNELEATALLDMSNAAYNNLWAYYADTMEWAWNSSENERDRANSVLMTKMAADANLDIAEFKADYASSATIGSAIFDFAKSNTGAKVVDWALDTGSDLIDTGLDWLSSWF